MSIPAGDSKEERRALGAAGSSGRVGEVAAPAPSALQERAGAKRGRDAGKGVAHLGREGNPDPKKMKLQQRRKAEQRKHQTRLHGIGSRTLLVKLLSSDIKKERSWLLQAVRFITANDFFTNAGEDLLNLRFDGCAGPSDATGADAGAVCATAKADGGDDDEEKLAQLNAETEK